MQTDSKRTDKWNTVAWRISHFSWWSRVTFCCSDYFCILYALKKKMSGETDPKTHLRLPDLLLKHGVLLHVPAAQSERGRIWTHISDIRVSVLNTELSFFFFFSLFLFREIDYIPVLWCIESQLVGIWTKQTSFPSFLASSLTERASICLHLQMCIWQRLFLWSQYQMEACLQYSNCITKERDVLQKYLEKQCFCWNVLY